MTLLSENTQFASFQNSLMSAGVVVCVNGTAESAFPGRSMHYVTFSVSKGASVNAVVMDYGRDGYSLYLESPNLAHEDDVAAIVSPLDRTTLRTQVEALQSVIRKWDADGAEVPMRAIVEHSVQTLAGEVK